jgi:hypothetical protein
VNDLAHLTTRGVNYFENESERILERVFTEDEYAAYVSRVSV